MSEILTFTKDAARATIYKEILPQIKSLVEDEPDLIANLANISAILKETLGFFWVGFYVVKDNQLVLGPFQGSLACTRIKKGLGICGKAWETEQTIIVPDVEKFEGHIACSSLSRSEIVVPVFIEGQVIGVLDVDSVDLNFFNDTDAHYLEKIASLITTTFILLS